mmetsp:Transcript_8959/g.8319  ORF Transcript_8959/g.8319 Transcript_8959/m.8319 type:complete len:129 (-) Transcript_8959:393-779(-)
MKPLGHLHADVRSAEAGRHRTEQAPDNSLLDKNNGDLEEDMRAEMMKQQEELEAAVFKKFFHTKIKQMSCPKKLKYIAMVMIFSSIVTGYFILSNQLITTMNDSFIESLDYYDIISDRDPLLSVLVAV